MNQCRLSKSVRRLSFRGVAVPVPEPPSVDTSMLPEHFHALAWPTGFTPTQPEGLACSPRALWDMAYADDARELMSRFHTEALSHRNVIIGMWAPHAAHGRVRLITYELSTDAPVGPKETRVLEESSPKCQAERGGGRLSRRRTTSFSSWSLIRSRSSS